MIIKFRDKHYNAERIDWVSEIEGGLGGNGFKIKVSGDEKPINIYEDKDIGELAEEHAKLINDWKLAVRAR